MGFAVWIGFSVSLFGSYHLGEYMQLSERMELLVVGGDHPRNAEKYPHRMGQGFKGTEGRVRVTL